MRVAQRLRSAAAEYSIPVKIQRESWKKEMNQGSPGARILVDDRVARKY